jgi:hypothetical protein
MSGEEIIGDGTGERKEGGREEMNEEKSWVIFSCMNDDELETKKNPSQQ